MRCFLLDPAAYKGDAGIDVEYWVLPKIGQSLTFAPPVK